MTSEDHSKQQMSDVIKKNDLLIKNATESPSIELHLIKYQRYLNGSFSNNDGNFLAAKEDVYEDDVYEQLAYNFEMTDDQNKATNELHNLKIDLGYTGMTYELD